MNLNIITEHDLASPFWLTKSESHEVVYPTTNEEIRPALDCSECIAVVQDPRWMAMFSELFGAASSMCSLIGGSASRYVPILSILSAPVYLFHAVKHAKERFKTAATAYKTSRFADLFFWAGRGVSAVASAMSDIIKPFAGTATLVGLSQIVAIKFLFATLFPIILIVLNVVGGASQCWALGRSISILRQFKLLKSEACNGTREGMELFLGYLQGPKGRKDSAKLKKTNWDDSVYTSGMRQKLMEKRIELLLGYVDGDDELFLAEGMDIVNVMEGEIKRKVVEEALNVIAALVTMAAAVLFLAFPQHKTKALALALTSSALGVFNIAFTKSIPYKRYRPKFLLNNGALLNTD